MKFFFCQELKNCPKAVIMLVLDDGCLVNQTERHNPVSFILVIYYSNRGNNRVKQ